MNIEHELLSQCLRESLGITDPARVQEVMAKTQALAVTAGQTIMRQGDSADGMYLIVSGRLRAIARFDNEGRALAHPTLLNEMGRGELFGEIGVIKEQARSADVVAVRDSLLLKMSAEDFKHWLNNTPEVSLTVMRRVIERMSNSQALNTHAAKRHHVVNVCVLPITKGAERQMRAFAAQWQIQLRQALQVNNLHDTVRMNRGELIETPIGPKVQVMDPMALERAQLDLVEQMDDQINASPQAKRAMHDFLIWLHEQENEHEMMLMLARREDSAWTRLCMRHADLIVLLADAGDPENLSAIERSYLCPNAESDAVLQTRQMLVLLQKSDCSHPSDTARWFVPREHMAGTLRETKPLSHHHVRLDGDTASAQRKDSVRKDLARLARIVTGRSVSLVLSGGGARGFSEFGVLQALQEAGVELDMVGGTSIGSIVGGYAAIDMDALQAQQEAGETFKQNPTRDINWLPTISIVRGARLLRFMNEAIRRGFKVEANANPHIEDMWIPYFCIASNYSQVHMQVLRRGSVALSMTASAAIPAALPPSVWDGDLLVDGGIFNNYPVDVMRAQGATWVLGVNLDVTNYRRLTFETIPHPFKVLWDKWTRPKSKQRYRGVPSIASIVFNTAVMASIEHQQRMDSEVDVVFKPPLKGIGMMDWQAFDKMVSVGLQHAREVLAAHGFKK